MIAFFLWNGATQSILSAKVRRRLPVLRARALARRTLTVPHDLPLSEAVRRAQDAEAGSIVVLGVDGSVSGIVNEAAVLATPEERRPWVAVSTVARSVEPGLRLPADIAGEPLVRAMQRTPGLGVPPDGARRRPVRGAGHRGRRPRLRRRHLRRRCEAARAARLGFGPCPTPFPAPADTPADSSWSGVHRGPLQEGEWVRLTDTKGRRHNIRLEAGKRFFSNKGHLDHDELIGRDEGFSVTSSAGGEYLVFRPLLSEFVVSMPRGAAVVYPKDAAQIVAMADVFPGARVVEAGVGLGRADLLAAARRRARRPRVVVRAPRRSSPTWRRRTSPSSSTAGTPPGSSPSVTWSRSMKEEDGSVDRVVLDMLAPWECVDRVAQALAPGGIVCAYVATTTQLGRTVETIRAHGGFTEPQPWETLVRDWHVEGLAVRPGHKMIGHTGFLVTARRMAPGQVAPAKKRRPAPGAYGVDYTGPRPSGLPPTAADETQDD